MNCNYLFIKVQILKQLQFVSMIVFVICQQHIIIYFETLHRKLVEILNKEVYGQYSCLTFDDIIIKYIYTMLYS